MANIFRQFFFIPTPTLTEKNCPDQAGRVFIVTGGYGGVGFELSQILYAHNAIVYIAGRSESKASSAIDRIKTGFPNSTGRLEFMNIDLSDLKTVKPGVQAFLAKEQQLHVLVNNAGVMYPPQGSVDAHGNELQMGTNCLGSCLLYNLLQPVLSKTAASAPSGTVRVAWAGSLAVDLVSPKPGGIVMDESGRPLDKGVQPNYGQSKVGNVFFAREYARTSSHQTRILHVAFNPGNLRTDLQRHWTTIDAKIVNYMLYPAIYGAYTELWSVLTPDLTLEKSGAYVLPWGRIGGFRGDVEKALEPAATGEPPHNAAKFVAWCEGQIKPYM